MPHDTLVVGPGETDNAAFGELLRRYRAQTGLSRAGAAERLGFTSEYLRLIERGKRTPVYGSMPLIFSIYHVNYITDGDSYVVDEVAITFTSRIREPRKEWNREEMPDPNRAQQIAQIIELLVQADEKKLRRVYGILRSR